jgi:Fe-S cluster assembly iron-binding protein IscA
MPFLQRKEQAMLAISPAASAAISKALEGAPVPDGAGFRLAAGPQTDRGVPIEIAFVPAAEPGDEVIGTEATADVFVEPQTAQLLTDQVLDADVSADGAVSFTLHPQPASPETDAG